MAYRRLGAWDLGKSFEFEYHFDTSKTIPDPARVVALGGEGQEEAVAALVAAGGEDLGEGKVLLDKDARLPDPGFVKKVRFGKTGGDGKPLSVEQALSLAEEEVASVAPERVPLELGG